LIQRGSYRKLILDDCKMTHVYREYRDGDEIALEDFLRGSFKSFRQRGYWAWKYKLNPCFDPSLVAIVEDGGRIIGCNHWSIRPIKVDKNLEIKAALAADVAVDKAYRGQGLGKDLVKHLRVAGVPQEKGIIFSYMFTNSRLNRGLYQQTAGYTRLPTSTVSYRKLFNCNELKAKIEDINKALKANSKAKERIRKINLNIEFNLKGSPKFALDITPEGIQFIEEEQKNVDIKIEGAIPLTSSLMSGEVSTCYLLNSWIRRKIKITRGVRHIFTLWKTFKILKEASNTKP
jgi:GNAT superfamily N-acetyltransferase